MASAPDQPAAPGPEVPISDEEEAEAVRKANMFDIRRLIGGLFAVYGVILVVLGLAGSHTVTHKADNINIDLWAGIGILVFAVFMIGWALVRPITAEPPEERGKGSGRIRRAPAT